MTMDALAHKLNLGSVPGVTPELQRTLAASGVGLYHFDGASNTFAIDRTCRRIFDIDDDVVLSPDIMVTRIHPEDLDRYWAAAADSMRGGEFACDYRVVHRDGSIRFVSGRGHVAAGPGGAAPRLEGVVIDVTARRSLEAELLSTQSQMQNLADAVPGLFAFIDSGYVVRFLSAHYDEWYGYSRERHLHQHMAEVVGAEAFARRKPLYDRALAGETIHYEEERTMASGERRYYALTYRPAVDTGGAIMGVISLGIDITERRAMENALEAKTQELQRSNQDLEQFAYVASHDLKAPLRAIDILVDWLRDDLENYEGGEVRENLALLKQRTGRLHRLLDDLLAYSRAGRKTGDIAATDTRLLVQDLAILLDPPPGMQVMADPGLPVITTHATPLEQVLRNLLNNAIKHHPTGSGHVGVTATDHGDLVEFAVTDDGGGIPAEFAEKVFQMFQTLKPRDEVEGSGMGLAIVKRIVEWQGGRIWFEPGPGGRGTVFRFTWRRHLPGAETPAADVPSLASMRTPTEQDDDREPHTAREHTAG
jgi:PAS domain S-box-containing protein